MLGPAKYHIIEVMPHFLGKLMKISEGGFMADQVTGVFTYVGLDKVTQRRFSHFWREIRIKFYYSEPRLTRSGRNAQKDLPGSKLQKASIRVAWLDVCFRQNKGDGRSPILCYRHVENLSGKSRYALRITFKKIGTVMDEKLWIKKYEIILRRILWVKL